MAPGARIVGLDVGGTQVKGGWIERGELPRPDSDRAAPRRRAIATDLDRGVDDFLERLTAFARELGYEGALGVGVPGVFDRRTGALTRSANMHALDGLHLEQELRRRLGAAPTDVVAVDNDANAAAYGEQWLGAGTDVDDLILITLGTGVGGGVVLGGKVFRGPTGRGGEIGHLVVAGTTPIDQRDADLVCGCGAYGCLERFVSATAAERRARAAGLIDDLVELSRRATAGDGPERALLIGIGRDLGAGILAASAVLDVTTILIGGGFGAALELLRPGIEAVLAERDYGGDEIFVRAAGLGADAGWIGAVRLAVD